MDKKKNIEYEDIKVPRYRVDDKLEFYLIDHKIETTTELGLGLDKVSGKRETKKEYHALIVKDPEYGHLPYDVWVEKRRQDVAGALSLHTNTNVSPGTISVTSGVETIYQSEMTSQTCSKCGEPVVQGAVFCHRCGSPIEAKIQLHHRYQYTGVP